MSDLNYLIIFLGKSVKAALKDVTMFVSEEFAQTTFDSCKDVVNPATNGPALALLCGPWGTTMCTPQRWFDYLGSTTNGYSPFDVFFDFDPEPGFSPEGELCTGENSEGEQLYSFHQNAKDCNLPVDDGVILKKPIFNKSSFFFPLGSWLFLY